MSDTPETPEGGKPEKTKRKQQVYTLVVELGRSPGDGLPEGATGAALMCFASGVDEDEAVRETVAVLKVAELSPVDITGYGTLAEREKQGHEIDADERELMARALAENAVIVAQMTPFYDEPEETAPAPAQPVRAVTPAAKPANPAARKPVEARKPGTKGPTKGPAKGKGDSKPPKRR